jgi:hypothetical protein
LLNLLDLYYIIFRIFFLVFVYLFIIVFVDFSHVNVGNLDQTTQYAVGLQSRKLYKQLSQPSYYAVADHVEGVVQDDRYQILHSHFISCSNGPVQLWTCTCPDNVDNKVYIDNLSDRVRDTQEQLDACKEDYCVHCNVAGTLFSCQDSNIETTSTVDTLSSNPLLVAVYDEKEREYGIVKLQQVTKSRVLMCMTCTTKRRTCVHVRHYRAYCKDNNVHVNTGPVEASVLVSDYSCVSRVPIPFKLPDDMATIFDEYESGDRQLPTLLVPDLSSGNIL